MLSQKEKCFHTRMVSLEQLVPQNNFYRHLEAKLDLRFVYALVQDTYAPATGRPSIDPVVFFKLQLIMFFEGIRSERQLMETVNVNLSLIAGTSVMIWMRRCPTTAVSAKSAHAMGWRSFNDSLSGLSSCASKPDWSGARSCILMEPRSEQMPPSMA
jgi:transposase-like protein DUF772